MRSSGGVARAVAAAVALPLVLAACTTGEDATLGALTATAEQAPEGETELDRLIAGYAARYDLPVELVREVVESESNFNPAAYNAGNWGLMQIRYDTARTMGYRGEPEGLLDAETNLTYAVKYLRGAWLVADQNPSRAVSFYRRGYYYDAKRKGLLVETGLRSE